MYCFGEITFMALAPKSSVPDVSPESIAAGEAQTMSEVRQLPPSASASMYVSLESLYRHMYSYICVSGCRGLSYIYIHTYIYMSASASMYVSLESLAAKGD